jgi:O-Antigen ligase
VSAGTPRSHGPTFALPLRVPSRRIPRDVQLAVLTSLLALEVGAGVVEKRSLALLPVAALGGLLLLVDGRARILFLVFGGLFLLQSSDSFGKPKLLYLAGVFAAAAGASFQFTQRRDWRNRIFAWPLVRASIILFALLTLSLFVARGNGVQRTDWLRDAAPYIFFGLMPIFALDAQAAFSRKALVRILAIAGSVATVSFSTHWLEARNIAQFPFSRLALSSFFFPAALFAYSMAASLHERTRMRWLALAAGVFALSVVTGTRSTLLFILIPVVVVFGARRNLSARFAKLVVVVPISILLIAAGAYAVVAATHASTTIISKRISVLKETGTSADASYLDRQAQTHAAERLFFAHPVLGTGPGTNFQWTVTNGGKRSAFIIDSPLDFPAKYGAAGLIVLAVILLSYGSFLRSALRDNHPRTETLALVGYAALALANGVLTNTLEDKGFTLGLLLLLALVFRTADPPGPPDTQRQDRRVRDTNSPTDPLSGSPRCRCDDRGADVTTAVQM